MNESSQERWLGRALLLIGVLFTLGGFLPELRFFEVHHSDSMFHLSILRALDNAVMHGRNPFDFWYDASPFGYALFRTYQYLPYLGVYGFYLATFKLFTLAQALQITTVLLAVAVPLAFYHCARVLGLASLESGLAAIAAVLISERDNFGLGLQNFTYGTAGIITQLWAIVFLAPTVAYSYRYLTSGKGLSIAVPGIFLTFGSHVVVAFVLIFFCAVTTVYGVLARIPGVIRRSTLFAGLGALVTAHQWIFVLTDAPYINQSNIEPRWKYAGLGWEWVIETFWRGDLFDNNRFPALTILFLIGTAAGVCQWSLTQSTPAAKHLRWPLFVSLLLMVSLMVGWEAWGSLLRDTPVLRSLHLHRFIVGTHFFAVFVIAIGAGALVRICSVRNSLLVLSLFFLFVLLRPAFIERGAMYAQAGEWRTGAGTWKEGDRDFEALLQTIESLPRGWVYSGAKQSWQGEILRAGHLAPHYLILARGLNSLGGMLYHAFSLAGDSMFEFNPSRDALYELFGVGSVIAPQSWGGTSVVSRYGTFGDLTLWTRQPNRLLVGDKTFSVCGDLRDAGGFMQRWTSSAHVERRSFGEILPGQCPALFDTKKFSDAVPPLEGGAPPVSRAGVVLSEEPWVPWAIEGRVKLERSGIVVALTGFHPSWRATINDLPAKPIWVTPGFLALDLPAGEHQVRFEYLGSRVKLLLVAMALAVIVAVWGYNRRRSPL